MLKVLIVDDDFYDTQGIVNHIAWEKTGVSSVLTAQNGREGYKMALENAPDIVISDISMPAMGGLEMIEKISSVLPKTEYIIISCHDEFNYAKLAITLNVSGYVLKPIVIEELEQTLIRVAEKINRDKELFAEIKKRIYDEVGHSITTGLGEPLSDVKAPSLPLRKSGRRQEIAIQVREYVDANFTKIPNVPSISNALFISPGYANTIFKQEFDINIAEYIYDKRLKMAKELLTSPSARVSEVSETVGYSSKSYFSAIFKKHTGLSPRDYRDKYAKRGSQL